VITQDSPPLPNTEFLPSDSIPEASLAPEQLQVLELLNEINAVAIKLRAQPENGTGPGVSAAEHAVMTIIKRIGAVTVPRIAQQRFTSRQNIQILVDRLEKEGHLETVKNPAHKRSTLVRLTEEGKRWLQDDEQKRKLLHHQIGSLFSTEEMTLLRAGLKKSHTALAGHSGLARNGHTTTAPNESAPPTKAKLPVPSNELPTPIVEEQFPVSLL